MKLLGRGCVLVWALVMAAGVVWIAAPAAAVEKIVAKYKVGDRVEVNTLMSNSPEHANWRKGTVTVVDTTSAVAYAIQLDPVPGQLPKVVTIPMRPYADGWIRPIGGPAAPAQKTDKLHVDASNTVQADRAPLDCANLLTHQPRTHNGAALPEELAKKLIRCTFEKPSAVGADGVTIVDIEGFTIGSSRKWIASEDYGPGGTASTLVYPVRVTWNQKTFYRSYNDVLTGKQQFFTCYVNVDMWHCGQSQLIKDGVKSQVPVQP